MDDGRLPGTSSSTRSPSAQDREISPSHTRRRPSYNDASMPSANFVPHEGRYPPSPTRHAAGVPPYGDAGPSNYASRSPRYANTSPREGGSTRTWEMNKAYRTEEPGYGRARWSPTEGGEYPEERDWRGAEGENGYWIQRERRPSGGHGTNGWREEYPNGQPNGYDRETWREHEEAVSPSRARYPPSPNGLYGGPVPYPPHHSPNGRRNGYDQEALPYEGRRPSSRDRPYGDQSAWNTPSKHHHKADYFQNGHRFGKQPYSTPARQSRTPSPPSTIDLTTPHKRRLAPSQSPEETRAMASPAFSRHSGHEMASPYNGDYDGSPRRTLFPEALRRPPDNSTGSPISRDPRLNHPFGSPMKGFLSAKSSPVKDEQVAQRSSQFSPPTKSPQEPTSQVMERPPDITQADGEPSRISEAAPQPLALQDVDMMLDDSALLATEPADNKAMVEPQIEAVIAPVEEPKRTPEELQDLIKTLQSRYKYLDRQWKLQTERIDRIVEGRKKRFALEKVVQTPATPGMGYLFSDVESPAVPTRSSRRSAATVFFGDAVRSDLEMEAIMEKIQMEESQDATFRSRYTTATIPDMDIVKEDYSKTKDDFSDAAVSDPEEFYGVKASPDRWTSAEEEVFAARYLEYPKQFGEIAAGLENKSPEQCVEYYYLNKRRLDFRGKSSTGKRKPGRKAGKGKGRSLLADIQAAEKEQKQPRRDQQKARAERAATEETPPAEEETTTSDAESPARAAIQLPEAEFQDSPMDVDSNEPAAVDVSSRLDTRPSDLPIMPLPGTGSYASTSIMYASPNDPRLKRTKFGLDNDLLSARRRPAMSSYWSVQEKLTAVTSHESHGADYGKIAADVGTKSATQIRNFFQHQAPEYLVELSNRAKAASAFGADDSRMDVDGQGLSESKRAFDVNRSHTSTPQRWSGPENADRSFGASSPVKLESTGRPEQAIILPSMPSMPSISVQVSHERSAPEPVDDFRGHFSDPAVSTQARPVHSLPPISSLPFESPSTFGDRFTSSKARMPISSLLNDGPSRSPPKASNDSFRDWFGEPKRLLPHEMEAKPSSEHFPISNDREWPERRHDSYTPVPHPAIPARDYRPPPRDEYGAYPSEFGTHARPAEYGRPVDSYSYRHSSFGTPDVHPDYRYGTGSRVEEPAYGSSLPAREDAWRSHPVEEYPPRRPSPAYSHQYRPDRSLPPLSTDYPYRQPSPGPSSYPYAAPQGRPSDYPPRAPSPGYPYRNHSVPAPYSAEYEDRRLPIPREYSTYRTPPAADNALPSGYYDARPPPTDHYGRPLAPPLSQPPSAWPADPERHRYPSEYPVDYPPHDHGYYGR